MPSTINVGGSGTFKATSAVTGTYSLSTATSPLIFSPPAGKVIKLERLTITDDRILVDTTISVGGVDFINGGLRGNGVGGNTFNINCPNTGQSTNSSRGHVGVLPPISPLEVDTSITITTTDTVAENVYYTVTYGDLE